LLATWFTVDGCYAIYWSLRDPEALQLMRSANFLASLVLYWMCGLVWYFQGSLREAWLMLRSWRAKAGSDR
jgi:hypothetical protein